MNEKPLTDSAATYHIEGVLGVTKSSLKRSIWKQAEGAENAVKAIAILDSRRGSFFTLDELNTLCDWLIWNDAAADGVEGETTGLTEYRNARCRKRYDRAVAKLIELRNRNTQPTGTT